MPGLSFRLTVPSNSELETTLLTLTVVNRNEKYAARTQLVEQVSWEMNRFEVHLEEPASLYFWFCGRIMEGRECVCLSGLAGLKIF